jgi:hypothetical protein
MKKMIGKIVILLLFLACITVSVSAYVTAEACEASGGWYSNVYSSGQVVTTPVLDNGRIYTITAGEIFWVDYTPNFQADAQFYSEDGWTTWFKPESPPGTTHSFLQMNDKDVNWGDTPNLDASTWHEYTVKFTGQGKSNTLRIIDWYDNNYDNNVCHLPVCIIPEPPKIPEFPSAFLPAAMIIGFLGAVLLIQRTREQ